MGPCLQKVASSRQLIDHAAAVFAVLVLATSPLVRLVSEPHALTLGWVAWHGVVGLCALGSARWALQADSVWAGSARCFVVVAVGVGAAVSSGQWVQPSVPYLQPVLFVIAVVTGGIWGLGYGLVLWPLALALPGLRQRAAVEAADRRALAVGGWALLWSALVVWAQLQASGLSPFAVWPMRIVLVGAVGWVVWVGLRLVLRRNWLTKVRTGRIAGWVVAPIEECSCRNVTALPSLLDSSEPEFVLATYSSDAEGYRVARHWHPVAMVPKGAHEPPRLGGVKWEGTGRPRAPTRLPTVRAPQKTHPQRGEGTFSAAPTPRMLPDWCSRSLISRGNQSDCRSRWRLVWYGTLAVVVGGYITLAVVNLVSELEIERCEYQPTRVNPKEVPTGWRELPPLCTGDGHRAEEKEGVAFETAMLGPYRIVFDVTSGSRRPNGYRVGCLESPGCESPVCFEPIGGNPGPPPFDNLVWRHDPKTGIHIVSAGGFYGDQEKLVVAFRHEKKTRRVVRWRRDSKDTPSPRCVPHKPVRGPLATVVDLEVGYSHYCVRLEDGRVRCWGRGRSGELGYGANGPVRVPALAGDVRMGEGVKKLALGNFFSCALLDTGRVRCWGTGVDTVNGTPSWSLGRHVAPQEAQDIPLLQKASDIASYGDLVCVLLETGLVSCWKGRYTPLHDHDVQALSPPTKATALTVGLHHSCVLHGDGRVTCWGKNNDGQLGTPDRKKERHTVTLTEPATAIAVGEGHTCAVLESGSLSCWGRHASGQLCESSIEEPRRFGAGVRRVRASVNTTCVILVDGTATCGGYESSALQEVEAGALHDLDSRNEPEDVSSVPRLVDVDLGTPLCILLEDNTVWCKKSEWKEVRLF